MLIDGEVCDLVKMSLNDLRRSLLRAAASSGVSRVVAVGTGVAGVDGKAMAVVDCDVEGVEGSELAGNGGACSPC